MRVLVVEDDPALRGVVVAALRESGYAVDGVGGVVAALAACDLAPYDLAVVDLGLPDGDGIQLCRELRGRAPTRVLILTARAALDDRVDGLDAGADDYLTKPFDLPELLARVRALLRRPAADGDPVLDVAGVRLDPASHRVWRDGVLIPLTGKEFALLHHLMAHAGRVVRRSELLDSVWDAHYDGLSNVVDVHVASLRRKLASPTGPLALQTVRGIGFVLGEEAGR